MFKFACLPFYSNKLFSFNKKVIKYCFSTGFPTSLGSYHLAPHMFCNCLKLNIINVKRRVSGVCCHPFNMCWAFSDSLVTSQSILHFQAFSALLEQI